MEVREEVRVVGVEPTQDKEGEDYSATEGTRVTGVWKVDVSHTNRHLRETSRCPGGHGGTLGRVQSVYPGGIKDVGNGPVCSGGVVLRSPSVIRYHHFLHPNLKIQVWKGDCG